MVQTIIILQRDFANSFQNATLTGPTSAVRTLLFVLSLPLKHWLLATVKYINHFGICSTDIILAMKQFQW